VSVEYYLLDTEVKSLKALELPYLDFGLLTPSAVQRFTAEFVVQTGIRYKVEGGESLGISYITTERIAGSTPQAIPQKGC
jgi:hypothetical protein